MSRTQASASTFKGTGFRGYRKYLETVLANEERESILRDLRPDVRELFIDDVLLVSTMYPIELQHHFLETFGRHMGKAADESLRAMGAKVAETDLVGVYRMFLRGASVPLTLQILGKVWNNYFSTGHAVWKAGKGNEGVMQITDPAHHRLHYPVAAGYIEQ
ncbi:MAG: hypothetical protein H5U40_07680, partial [Polyangiaceae bacterium]|nr:hypothetical protein [Polyangiaceae bacterium]